MLRQRTAARRALGILQNVSIHFSDDDRSSNTEIDPVVNAALASSMVVESDNSITEESDSHDELDGQVTDSALRGGGQA